MVDAGNATAVTLYRSFGMRDSGPVFRGRIGPEHRLEVGPTDASHRGSTGV